MATLGTDTLDLAAVELVLGPHLTAEQAESIIAQGHDAGLFALLTLAKRLADQQAAPPTAVDPSTPSGQTPPYKKPAAKGRVKRRPCQATPAVGGHSRRESTVARNIHSRPAPSATGR
jgi:hypothetical protein